MSFSNLCVRLACNGKCNLLFFPVMPCIRVIQLLEWEKNGTWVDQDLIGLLRSFHVGDRLWGSIETRLDIGQPYCPTFSSLIVHWCSNHVFNWKIMRTCLKNGIYVHRNLYRSFKYSLCGPCGSVHCLCPQINFYTFLCSVRDD